MYLDVGLGVFDLMRNVLGERIDRGLRLTGRGPVSIRLGRTVRYRPGAVDTWLLSQEREVLTMPVQLQIGLDHRSASADDD